MIPARHGDKGRTNDMRAAGSLRLTTIDVKRIVAYGNDTTGDGRRAQIGHRGHAARRAGASA
jgi:hypothetical protein